jgi:hypothetical protein
MPPRGGVLLSVLVLPCAVALATAGAASASDVVLWACHGPAGQTLGSARFQPAAKFTAMTGTLGAGCDADGTDVDQGGLHGALTPGTDDARPEGASEASWTLPRPPDVTLKAVSILRRTTSPGDAPAGDGPQEYTLTTSNATLESATQGVDGEFTAATPAGGDYVKVAVTCTAAIHMHCGGAPIGFDVQHVAMTVTDAKPPYAAAGVSGDVSGRASIFLQANDVGVGLARADAFVDGRLVDTKPFDDACTELSPGDGTADLALGATCPPVDDLTLSYDTNQFADGAHRLDVKLYDGAGNEFDVRSGYAFTITNHPDPGNPSATLSIGSGNTRQTSGSGGSATGGTGGVAGASATSCGSPKLSMFLSQKPLKVSNGVPVLKYGKRYRFRGRLTCVIGGKRRSAAKRTRIDLLNTIGKKTYSKGGATVRDAGKITIILAYKSSRTLVFRYVNPDGRRSQVKLKITVSSSSR